MNRDEIIALLHLLNGRRSDALALLTPLELIEWHMKCADAKEQGVQPRVRERDAWIAIMLRREETP